jgi:hypothetical protein
MCLAGERGTPFGSGPLQEITFKPTLRFIAVLHCHKRRGPGGQRRASLVTGTGPGTSGRGEGRGSHFPSTTRTNPAPAVGSGLSVAFAAMLACDDCRNEISYFCLSRQTIRPLVYDCVPFLNMPFVTIEAVKGIQIRQPVEPFCFAKQLHRPSAFCATRRLQCGTVGVFAVHDTTSN